MPHPSAREVRQRLRTPRNHVVGADWATLCALLPAQEIADACAGKSPSSSVGQAAMCEYAQIGSIKAVPVGGLGHEAHTLNDALIDVRVNDEVAFTLGILLFVQRPPPVTREASRSALIALARKVTGRLKGRPNSRVSGLRRSSRLH